MYVLKNHRSSSIISFNKWENSPIEIESQLTGTKLEAGSLEFWLLVFPIIPSCLLLNTKNLNFSRKRQLGSQIPDSPKDSASSV